MTAANKRIITLESDINAARQRLLMADDEKRAQQASLDKMSADAARLTRKLTETEASLNATQGRLRQVEGNFAEVNNERARLVDRARRKPTNATITNCPASACASRPCRRAPPRPTICSAKRANICSPAPKKSATSTAG